MIISEKEKERRRKISETMQGYRNALGFKRSEEFKRKVSKGMKGKQNSLGRKNRLNYETSEETKRKQSKAKIGYIPWMKNRQHTEETRKKISDAHKGEKSRFWRGGISFEPYSIDWTETLKKAIRERDHYLCQICNQYGNDVHHIDYDKKNCNTDNLITLCHTCHLKTNGDRKYWGTQLSLECL